VGDDRYYVMRNVILNHREDYDGLNVWIELKKMDAGYLRGNVFEIGHS
jgi:hypothetical protein